MTKTTAFLAATFLLTSTASANKWTQYQAKKYGFSMLIPAGTKLTDKKWPRGWGGMKAEVGNVELMGMAKLGAPVQAKDIEKFGLDITRIPASKWQKIDNGKNKKGWSWYKTFKATQGDTVFYGAYGTGPKGNYLLLLKTRKGDVSKHEDSYKRWYESLTVF